MEEHWLGSQKSPASDAGERAIRITVIGAIRPVNFARLSRASMKLFLAPAKTAQLVDRPPAHVYGFTIVLQHANGSVGFQRGEGAGLIRD
jgi:hypothetical protein